MQLEREQLDHVLAVDPHHEAAGVPRLEGGGHDHVAPGRQLEPVNLLSMQMVNEILANIHNIPVDAFPYWYRLQYGVDMYSK